MQVNVEDLSSVKKVLHIEIPKDDVVDELNKAYNNLKKNAKVKGFRPGKAPRSVLERLYKKEVHADVSSKLIQNSLIDAIKEKDLKVLGEPIIKPSVLLEGSHYKYNATVEVTPAIAEIDFKDLKLKKNLYKISDDEIDLQLKMQQKNLARYKIIEENRPVKEGDFVVIDYEGQKDGVPFEETQKTTNFTLKIGDGVILKEFDSQLLDMMPNDNKTINIHFPDNYHNAKLANLDIIFYVTLKEIREEILPEINDDFAKSLGKYENLTELKNAIRSNLKQGYDKRTEQDLNEQIFEAILSRVDFEAPDILVNYELENIILDTEKACSYYNLSLEQIGENKDSLKEKYKSIAEKQAKRILILGKIIDQEKLDLTNDELESAYKDMSSMNGYSIDKIKDHYKQNPDKLIYFKHTLLEKKALNLIINASTVEEIDVSSSRMSN